MPVNAPVKPTSPHVTRRSIIAAATGLAAAGCWSKFSHAQAADFGLPDAVDAMTKIMPTAAPRVTFTDANGKRLTLADYIGHPLVVNLWATWCGPCIAEIPSFAALASKAKSSGILVLPISIDITGADVVRPFYANHDIHSLPILLDPDGGNMQVLNTNSIPLSVVIDASGQMVARMDGSANWNTDRTISYLQSLGGRPAPKPRTALIPV